MDSRRNFVGKVAYGLAGTLAAGPARVLGANDRIRIGIIGAGDRGMGLVNHVRACPLTPKLSDARICTPSVWRRLPRSHRARRSIPTIGVCWTMRLSTR